MTDYGMPDKHYVGEVGTELFLNVWQDLSSASEVKMLVKKPDNTRHEWSAEIYPIDSVNTYLRHTIVEGDFNMSGIYEFQAWAKFAAWEGKGKTAPLMIYERYT